jgi:hypothetical protein
MTDAVDGAIQGKKPTLDCHARMDGLTHLGGSPCITARAVAAISFTYVSPLATTFIGNECAVNRMMT